ncbi:hypothetical protein SLEP1_g38705 [Rubroshorea leprosula]|uniref:TF-B3 domain-containing protein n=1 Tax=Rubroshorea leprosula TaxID=152421 RepID=A0AAV5KXV8_9ROSI|nr:hypothetical protein SLEP1_g38705 [Rubroshorea leprosula]
MEETSNGSVRKLQQTFYRKYFRRMIFGSPLSHNFHDQLKIPKTFVQNLEEGGRKLPDNVSLTGPGGATWKVGISNINGTLFFNEGWKDFVEDHLLEEDDILVFEYNISSSRFDVLTILDHSTCCEKVGSFFVKLFDAQENDNHLRKRKTKGPVGVGVFTDENRAQGSRRRIRGNVEINSNFTQDDEFILPLSLSESTSSDAGKSSKGKQRGRRRAIKTDNNIALRRARAEQIPGISNVVIITKCHVDRPYRVRMSLKWVAEHLSEQSRKAKKVLLSMDMQMQQVLLYINEMHKYAELTSGWKEFARQYCLEVSDVCLFNPAGTRSDDGISILTVRIFRNEPQGQNC